STTPTNSTVPAVSTTPTNSTVPAVSTTPTSQSVPQTSEETRGSNEYVDPEEMNLVLGMISQWEKSNPQEK
ncbi:MAG: hypothetical protein ACREBA_06830, partial [Nitrosotalea sp.]